MKWIKSFVHLWLSVKMIVDFPNVARNNCIPVFSKLLGFFSNLVTSLLTIDKFLCNSKMSHGLSWGNNLEVWFGLRLHWYRCYKSIFAVIFYGKRTASFPKVAFSKVHLLRNRKLILCFSNSLSWLRRYCKLYLMFLLYFLLLLLVICCFYLPFSFVSQYV